MKTCTRCGLSKDESEFYSQGHNRAGEHRLDPRCKQCRRAETRAFANRPPAKCRKCGTKLHREATTDLCGFCAPESPVSRVLPVEQSTPIPPSAAENRARIAGEQADESVMARGTKGGVQRQRKR